MLYIDYLVQFRKRGKKVTKALINSDNDINAINPAYAKQLGLQIRQINIGAQKIDSSSLENFQIVLARFQLVVKLCNARFF